MGLCITPLPRISLLPLVKLLLIGGKCALVEINNSLRFLEHCAIHQGAPAFVRLDQIEMGLHRLDGCMVGLEADGGISSMRCKYCPDHIAWWCLWLEEW